MNHRSTVLVYIYTSNIFVVYRGILIGTEIPENGERGRPYQTIHRHYLIDSAFRWAMV